MAHIDIVHDNGVERLFYNVDAAVGKGCPNRRADVLLVQYLLKEGCKAPGLAAIEEGAGFTQSVMEITGVWDYIWDGYLANYLNVLKRRGKPIVNDRQVDPAVGGHVRFGARHMQYTILYLNGGYSTLRPADMSRISEVADCPPELRPLLKLQWV
jgi:hypothetical protein